MLWLFIGIIVGFIIGFAFGYDEMEKKIRRKTKEFFNDDPGYVDSDYFNKKIFGDS